MRITSWDMMKEILKSGDMAKQLDPLMFEIVKNRDKFDDRKKIINNLESDIADKRIEHISEEHFTALTLEERDAKSYEKAKEATFLNEKLEWLKIRYLWVKLQNDIEMVTSEIEAYLPASKRALAHKIDDLYLEFMTKREFDCDGTIIY